MLVIEPLELTEYYFCFDMVKRYGVKIVGTLFEGWLGGCKLTGHANLHVALSHEKSFVLIMPTFYLLAGKLWI